VFHESRGKHYSNSFGEGDTLGIMICLPNNVVSLPPTHKDLVFNFI
jgi:Set1/Ash2 histone methyltransferase complex subunit ASH2